MIKTIIELLRYADGETDNIKFAQGSKKLPTNYKETIYKLKKEINSNLVKDFTSVFPDAKLTKVTEEEDA